MLDFISNKSKGLQKNDPTYKGILGIRIANMRLLSKMKTIMEDQWHLEIAASVQFVYRFLASETLINNCQVFRKKNYFCRKDSKIKLGGSKIEAIEMKQTT